MSKPVTLYDEVEKQAAIPDWFTKCEERSSRAARDKLAPYTDQEREAVEENKRLLTQTERDEWLEVRRQEGKNIDPETAEVTFWWTEVLDPYGVYDLPEEHHCVGRSYFAMRPGSKICVWDGDLPEETEKRIWERIKSGDLKVI
jgi:hypothetical protein